VTWAFLGSYRPAGLTVVDGARTVDVPNASWLALAPDGQRLYAVSEQADGRVTALDAETLAVLGQRPTGEHPTHVSVHGDHVLVANYGSGSVAVLTSDLEITDLVTFPDGGHAHQVVTDPSGRFVLAVDIGNDAIHVYTLVGGRLREHSVVTVAGGPRHVAFHPGGDLAYVVCEYVSRVVVCAWADGTLGERQAAATVRDDVANYPGEVVVSPDGRFVYVTNRGDNSVATFAAEPLRLLDVVSCGGDWPRHAALDPAGGALYVANQRSGTVTWLPRDPSTGRLSTVAGSMSAPEVAMVLFR
jgi:6-phosphogluconolactonase (cycloisomerase 2 family)